MEPRRFHKQDYEKITEDGRLTVATEYLYVNNFTADVQTWTPTGLTPYLNDSDANYISSQVTDQIDRNYDFANTAITDFATITQIELEVESRSGVLGTYVHCALSLDGVNFTEKLNCPIDDSDTWMYVAVDVTAFFASLANINSCTLRCTSHRPSSGAIRVRRARLKITYTVASTQQTKTLIEEYDY